MPINEATIKLVAGSLDRLPRRRKSYPKKQALEALTDKIFHRLSQGCSIDSIFWLLERELGITKELFEETLLSNLKEKYPNEKPEHLLATLISEGQPDVETTATPRGIAQQAPATGALPEPMDAEPESPETEGDAAGPAEGTVPERPAETDIQETDASPVQAEKPPHAFGDGAGLAKLKNYE